MEKSFDMLAPVRVFDDIAFVSSGSYYSGVRRNIAKAMKVYDMAAIERAASEMVAMYSLPSDALLVPVPSHLGYPTYTLELAERIAKATNSEIANVLRGAVRDMLYDRKRQRKQVSEHFLGLYSIEELPIDRPVFIIDNVLDTGLTARAACHTLGRGMMMVYAHAMKKSEYTEIEQLISYT